MLHTLNLRPSRNDIALIADHARDRFLVVDDVLLPLLDRFQAAANFERALVVPLTGSYSRRPISATKPSSSGRRPHLSTRSTTKNDPVHWNVLHLPAPTGGPRALLLFTARPCCTAACRGVRPQPWLLARAMIVVLSGGANVSAPTPGACRTPAPW